VEVEKINTDHGMRLRALGVDAEGTFTAESDFFLDIGLLRLYVALQQMLHRSMINTGEFP
jgi:hypothetical protein